MGYFLAGFFYYIVLVVSTGLSAVIRFRPITAMNTIHLVIGLLSLFKPALNTTNVVDHQ